MFYLLLVTQPLLGLGKDLASAPTADGCPELPSSLSGSPSFLQHAVSLEHRGATADNSTYSLFVKFHKVAGTTWGKYVEEIIGQGKSCGMSCGNPSWFCYESRPPGQLLDNCLTQHQKVDDRFSCPEEPRSCTWHASLGVIGEALAGQDLLDLASGLPAPTELWPDEMRLQLLWNVEWARSWLPSTFLNKRLVVTTILREPTEKMRSHYYFQQGRTHTHEGFVRFLDFCRDLICGNYSAEDLEKQGPTLTVAKDECVEYETWLGDGSLEKSKLTLSTQFDLVAITERMNEGLVSLGKLYGVGPREMAKIGRDIAKINDNANDKLDWEGDEQTRARFVANTSMQVYDFAQELFDKQRLELFGSEAKARRAVQLFEALDPDADV